MIDAVRQVRQLSAGARYRLSMRSGTLFSAAKISGCLLSSGSGYSHVE